MKYIILAILISIISTVNGQSRIDIYDYIFNQKEIIKSSKIRKDLLYKHLSSNADPIMGNKSDTVIINAGNIY